MNVKGKNLFQIPSLHNIETGAIHQTELASGRRE
jgi:hypothetical protein